MASYTSLNNGSVKAIGQAYGLSFTSVSPIRGGVSNSSFLGRAASGIYVITVLDSHSVDSANSLADLMMYVRQSGLPAPCLLANSEGSAVTQVQGRPIIVKTYISGQCLTTLSADKLPLAGRLLARLHSLDPPERMPCHGVLVPHDWRQQIGHLAEQDLMELLDRSERARASVINQPRGMIHGDFFGDNLIETSPYNFAILDWETSSIEPFVVDLGIAAIGLCRTDNRLDRKRLDTMLTGYCSERPLQDSESDRIFDAIESANAALAFGRFFRHNIRFPDTVPKRHYKELVEFARATF